MYIINSLLKFTIMKKIFTLLVAVGMFTLAQAQPGSRDNRQTDQRNNQQTDQRDYNKGYGYEKEITVNHNPYDKDDRYGNSGFGDERSMNMQIAQINRDFDYKIQRVRNSFFMNRWDKQRQIRFLEDQRQQEIRFVYMKFKNRNRYNDHDNRRY
jgi:hypothetical protein